MFDPWVGNIPWRRKQHPLQYSCLENSMDRGAWRTTVHGVTKSWTRLSDSHTQCGEWAEALRQGIARYSRQAAKMCRTPPSVFPAFKPCSISAPYAPKAHECANPGVSPQQLSPEPSLQESMRGWRGRIQWPCGINRYTLLT